MTSFRITATHDVLKAGRLMRMNACILLCFLFIAPCSFGQPALMKHTADDAYTITKMASKFHVQPRAVNDSFSADFMWLLLHTLDEDHTLYTSADIGRFQMYRNTVDDEILQKKTAFLQLFIQVTEKRLRQYDSLVKEICQLPVDFSADDAIDFGDTSYPADMAAIRLKLAHIIKYEMLEGLLDHTDTLAALSPARQKKFIDSIEIPLRKKTQVRQSRQINTLLQGAGGVATALCNEYCKTIAGCFDPHTAYFPLTEKENFESDLGNQPFRFGFKIDEAEGGGVVLSQIEPGSPAFKSGLLNEGDKLVKLQWQGSSAIDVSDADIDEVGAIFSQSNHATLILSVKKVDGSVRDVPLVKEQVETSDEENRVRSFVLKGSKTIGYIALPAFYSDWDDGDAGANGCANDVGKEILSLLKQNISGLIIDLRYNGGGSLQEATELAGIFIDAGPVEQIRRNDAKILTLKDVNRGTIYSGPLVLLVNGYSASASEMLAGTLQDYNRAIIAGSPTYGKATGQLILPLDTTINFESDVPFKETDSYLKLTTSSLYRITGTTPQGTGVIPDIVLPDILEAMPGREKDEHFWLHTGTIEANKYFKPLPSFGAALKQKTAAYADTMQYFLQLKDYISRYNQLSQQKKVSLKWSPALLARDEKQSVLVAYLSSHGVNNNDLFTIDDATAIKERLQVNASLKDMYATLKSYLAKDASVRVCFKLLCDMAQ